MRILCLHSRGGNNDVFKMQTAAIRNQLEDYEFEFVQGQSVLPADSWLPNATGIDTSDMWQYYNLLDPEEVLRTEKELLELLVEDGPYDGILGYSHGGALVCQALIRYAREHPGTTPDELPFRFAILFSAQTPYKVWKQKDGLKPSEVDFEDPMIANFMKMVDKNPLLKTTNLQPFELESGRKVVSDGENVMAKFDVAFDGVQIRIPTLHVRDDKDRVEYGAEAYELCKRETAQQIFHSRGHDFPRGADDVKRIAKAIRSMAEGV